MSGRRRGQAGLTLIEVVVALALTGMVAAMMFAVAEIVADAQQHEEETQYMQDNVQSCMAELLNGVRQAGTTFLSRQAQNGVPPNAPGTLWAVQVLDNASGAPGGDGPDSLRLIRVDDSLLATLMQSAPPNTGTLLVDQAGALQSGSYVVLSNFQLAVLYQLTANPIAQTVPGNSGSIPVQALSVSPLPGTAPFPFNAGLLVSQARPITYSIDTTVLNGTPALVLQDGAPLDTTQPLQVVADNIEDFEVALGVDGLFTGLPDGQLTEIGLAVNDDEWVYNVVGETMPPLPQGAVLAAVRITVIGRTRVPADDLGLGRPQAENRPAGPPDGYRRRLLSTMMLLRSLVTS